MLRAGGGGNKKGEVSDRRARRAAVGGKQTAIGHARGPGRRDADAESRDP